MLQSASAGGQLARVPDAGVAELVGHLYVCQGLSTYRIAEIVGISRQRVGRVLNRAGAPVKPRGAGRPRPLGAAQAALADLMELLYLRTRLTSGQIAAVTGIPDRTVRDRLRSRGVPMRTRGWPNREDRTTVPVDELVQLYVREGLSAAEAGRVLGVAGRVILRTAHDQGLPVRVGGPEPRRGPTEIELVSALYADPVVQQTMSRHGMPKRPADGPIWHRFPVPVRIGPELAEELYASCGLGLRHIELLSGQPAETIRAALHSRGVPLRSPGGRSPFMRRWRAQVRLLAGDGHGNSWPLA
jgi:transposase